MRSRVPLLFGILAISLLLAGCHGAKSGSPVNTNNFPSPIDVPSIIPSDPVQSGYSQSGLGPANPSYYNDNGEDQGPDVTLPAPPYVGPGDTSDPNDGGYGDNGGDSDGGDGVSGGSDG